MTAKKISKEDDMADETRRRIEEQEEERKRKLTEQTDKNVGGRPQTQSAEEKTPQSALDDILKVQRSSQSNLITPSREAAKRAEEALFTKETEDEKTGVKTRVSSISEDEANQASTKSQLLPQHQNLRVPLDGVPGILNLTADGTLNTDMSERTDKSVEEMNQLVEATAGPNPLPNRIGNELTNAENAFRAETMVRQGNTLKGYASQIRKMREKDSLDEEDKKQLEAMEQGLSR